MSLPELISQMYESTSPLDTFREHKEASCQTTFTKAEKTEFNTALDDLSETFKQGGKIRKALSIVRALLLMSPDKTISNIRKEGIFRCSRYEYRERTARVIVGDMLQNATIYGLSKDHLDYLHSVDNLLSFGPNLQKKRKSLVERLRKKESVAIKTLLASIETVFTYGLSGNWELSTDDPHAYSPEDMAEAFSYLLQLFQTNIGLKAKHFGMIDDSCTEKIFYQELLIDAAKICEFHATEIMVDAFPYIAIADGKQVKVESIDPLLEKSIRIGYIQANMQIDIRMKWLLEAHSSELTAMSMMRFAKECFDRAGEVLVTLVQNPIPRYVMRFLLDEKLFEPFSGNALFLEDLSRLEMLGTEDYITPDTVVEFPVIGNITVIDILKVQRFFQFTHQCFKEAFDRHPVEADRAKIQLRSCIPVFRHDSLLQLLNHLFPPFKAEEILTLLTCNPASAKYIDLQYMPIISAEGLYMLSPIVLSTSNLVRNLLCHNKKRLTLRDGTDPMQDVLVYTLKNSGFLAEDEITRSVDGKTLEIDILAYRDGRLFIFECKNAFHPCNVYEMRNSYQHITHAADQLEKRKSWLQDLSKQQTLFKSLGWDIPPSDQIITCIAIGNRVFNGYECAGHPVRQVHELLNVLRTGEVIIAGEKRRIWKEVSFSIDDLVAYIAGDTTTADIIQSTQPLTRQFRFGSKILSLSTYSMDMLKLLEISKERYPLVESTMFETDEQPL